MNDSSINNLTNESFFPKNSSDSNQTNSSNFKLTFSQNFTPGSTVGKHEDATVLHEEDLSKLNEMAEQQKSKNSNKNVENSKTEDSDAEDNEEETKDSNKNSETSKTEDSNAKDKDKDSPLEQPCLSGSPAPECVRGPASGEIIQQDDQNVDERDEICNNEKDDDGDDFVDAEDSESCPKSMPSGPQGCPEGYHEDAIEPICILGDEVDTQQPPSEDTSTEDTSTEDTPMEDTTTEDTTTEDVPFEEQLPPMPSMPAFSFPPGPMDLSGLSEEMMQGQEICDNGIDDDLNGFIDLEDAEQCAVNTLGNETMGLEPQGETLVEGKINSVVESDGSRWIADGEWRLILNNDSVSEFGTNMSWYSSNGTDVHTHQLTNFRSSVIGVPLAYENTSNGIVIKGVMDIGTDNTISWFGVPTMVSINDGKVLSISVDDNKTDNHFGGQPLLGIVQVGTTCSLKNEQMAVLSLCDNNGTSSHTIESPGGLVDFSKTPAGSVSTKRQQIIDHHTMNEMNQAATENGDTNSISNPDSQCRTSKIVNITANGFETDPSDYHPPSDAIDGDRDTWWSHNSEDPWILMDLGDPHPVCGISIEWNKGEKRTYSFEVELSKDGSTFEKVFEGKNKGGSELEAYEFTSHGDGRYVKLTIHDTTSKDRWVSIREIVLTINS